MTDTKPVQIDNETLTAWATDLNGPVAIHLRQTLLPVEGPGGVIFPPTYAGVGYNIDELWDGKKMATIDSVASQANRMEPIFKERPFKDLAPQITIRVEGQDDVSIFDIGHRLADAVVRSTDCAEDVAKAFRDWADGRGESLARLAPTSIVFGAWDSRGEATKIPRIVQSTIRAHDVMELKRSGQYIPPVDYAEHAVFSDKEKEKAEGNTKSPLAQKGFVHVPHSGPGGIIARGPIHRDVTVNLVALRRIPCAKDDTQIRPYILGLSLAAATHGFESFLRSGCLLTLDPDAAGQWEAIMRDGTRQAVDIASDRVLEYATNMARKMQIGTEVRVMTFDKDVAKGLVKGD